MERWKTISRSVVEREHSVVIGVCEAEIIVSFHPISIVLPLVYAGLLISRDESAIHLKGIRAWSGFKERVQLLLGIERI